MENVPEIDDHWMVSIIIYYLYSVAYEKKIIPIRKDKVKILHPKKDPYELRDACSLV